LFSYVGTGWFAMNEMINFACRSWLITDRFCNGSSEAESEFFNGKVGLDMIGIAYA